MTVFVITKEVHIVYKDYRQEHGYPTFINHKTVIGVAEDYLRAEEIMNEEISRIHGVKALDNGKTEEVVTKVDGYQVTYFTKMMDKDVLAIAHIYYEEYPLNCLY